MTDITTEVVEQNTDFDSLGPVDYIVVEFLGAANFTGEMAKELLALVDSGTVRVIDILILTKDEDGSVEAMELSDIEDSDRFRQSRLNWRRSWRRKTSCTSPPPWTRKHCRGAHLGEPVGCAIRGSGAPFWRPVDRHRTDSHSGDHRLHRGR